MQGYIAKNTLLHTAFFCNFAGRIDVINNTQKQHVIQPEEIYGIVTP